MTLTTRFAAILVSTVLSCGLMINLFVFQDVGLERKRSAQLAATSTQTARATAGAAVSHTANAPSSDAKSSSRVVMAAAQSIEIARSVQVALKTKGYHPGPADGVPGLMTQAALMAFEFDNGLPLTADVNSQRLELLVYGVPSSDGGRAASIALETGPVALGVIRTVQGSLMTAGYDVGSVDGLLNARTLRAIRDFEADQGLPETGRISGRLMSKLVGMANQGKLALKK
ncbi:MAG: peptidoglycan-binding domain-containing protein [Pseudomonadota bacterium]